MSLSVMQWRLLFIAAAITCATHHMSSAFSHPIPRSSSDRRSAITQIVSSTAAALVICTNQQPTLAVAPFAPIDTLVPAARVKVMVDRAVDIASNLVSADENNNTGSNNSKEEGMLHDLENLLLMPQNFNQGTTPIEVPQQPAKSYLNSYAEYRNSVSILEKPGAMLVQNGEIDTWKRLKRQEKAREDVDEIRAALNYYTSNLNFNAENFVLTAAREERSKMIREDRIPDVKSVIASDMGVRYLLRNDILTACDDARAELTYQMKQSSVDGRDLLDLLLVAQGACNKWFDLIDDKDTMAAMDIAMREK